MAIVKSNLLTQGLSGKIGKAIVFRQRNGKTVASAAPKPYPAATPNQALDRAAFAEAVHYAKTTLQNPALAEPYRAEARRTGRRAVDLAVADFRKGPIFGAVDFSGYTGAPDGLLLVQVSDNFRVARVEVSIIAGGALLESGEARNITGAETWQYMPIAQNPARSNTLIQIAAYDLAGNRTLLETTL